MTVFDFDAIIVGAGAAGLMAAIHAAERGRKVLLLEKGKKPGVKILMSGGTRCNITHDCDARGIVEAFGTNGKFLHSALAAIGPREIVTFFNNEGVATKVEDTGKVFPVSDRAVDVLEALMKRLTRSGATLALTEPVKDIDPHPEGGFRVSTVTRTLTAERVLVTTGGKSYPGCGTTGDGYAIATKFGHAIVSTRPALVPLTVQPAWIGELRGITIPDVNLKVMPEQGKALSQRRGSVLFAHFGLTGPAPLDVSRAVSGHAKPSSLILEADFLPLETEQAFDEFLRAESLASGKKQLAVILAEKLPRRLADQLLVVCGMAADRKAAALAKPDRLALVAAAKRLRLPLRGTLGFEKAEVTAGGVSLDEVDSRTMQSKRAPGLYFAGEVLDLDGWIGGYNFQSAWSTGWLAGKQL
ncbi:HI0933 family protein OS=Pirellula staleyi (strain ATCC 27377 / DSM 6068 / ICPB 4128) GN=Psta_0791 PE=4 SV=1: HI0933_like [Gemmata massiliana]|uniref:FAD-dependent oxidoreductase 2 FAD binding domain-containing protein n=1 Tax=Gemmata massiliana TaxID=1210884 RepID=A0A6P2CSC6_9BACT|nr:NAD(P)/FAD-dependent oxidoreductase [Gemmata massiliana]VTR91005.1 HI0933 family protein OS=Pirellula staleyi (strain ATCC 27377 / DSM 6068 / ICPB 4128) GN=Psta_0791 PE=4 SV=1: HI0933_like [Gemmata massiliana]